MKKLIVFKSELKIDDFFVSYANSDYVRDRKPNNGMLIDAKRKWNINLRYIVGDRSKDIIAGLRSG